MSDPTEAIHQAKQRYWRTNVTIMTILLSIWAFVGLGCGILWADWLNQWHIGGVPMGFWFAQQGSIATFVVIILVYAITMNRLDSKYHENVNRIKAAAGVEPQATTQTQGGDA